ncbi:MAG: Subtilisin inhibitor-like [Gaiellaceae bacterium]|nr:Subtilisin inhibitor-like [Gaiellaceae bacterium]
MGRFAPDVNFCAPGGVGQMVRRLACLALLVLPLAAACGSEGARTDLRLVATSGLVGKAVFHLRCGPDGGDVPRPRAACAAVEGRPGLVRRPKPFVCHGGSWVITITGRLDGRPVHSSTETCWTPQMALIRRLGIGRSLESHIVERRHVAARVTSRLPWPGPKPRFIDEPPGTPAWLVKIAWREAGLLGDPGPERVAFLLGKDDRIVLTGRFVCRLCTRPSNAQAPRGRTATIVVDPSTRFVTDFALHR